jgi:hypothetical protein
MLIAPNLDSVYDWNPFNMRKSRQSPTPPEFVFVRDVLPEFAKTLRASLRRDGQQKLAEQVSELRIYGRCDCALADCATFYCLPPEERKRLRGFGDSTYHPVKVARGEIVEVHLLDPGIATVLRQLFPKKRVAGWSQRKVLATNENVDGTHRRATAKRKR